MLNVLRPPEQSQVPFLSFGRLLVALESLVFPLPLHLTKSITILYLVILFGGEIWAENSNGETYKEQSSVCSVPELVLS